MTRRRLAVAVRALVTMTAITTLANAGRNATASTVPVVSAGDSVDADNLVALQKRFPPLSAFRVAEGQIAATLRTTDTVPSAYESGGKLYFVTQPGASDGSDTLHVLSDGLVRTVRLTPGGFHSLYFLDWTETDRHAVLEGSRDGDGKMYDWTLADGRFRRRTGTVHPPSTGWSANPQPQNPPTCKIHDGSVTFFGDAARHDATFSKRTLSDATHGVAFQDGITIGCRRVGSSRLIWLTADSQSIDGVTYLADDKTLEALFASHPNLTTTHYLAFSQFEGTGPMRDYLFLAER